MTSNLGSELLITKNDHQGVYELLKRTFKPEFINRIDEIIIFNPLTKDIQYKIVEKLLKDLKARLVEKQIYVEFSSKTKDYI